MEYPNASNFGVARVTKNEWNIQMKTHKVFNLVFLNASNFGIANVTKKMSRTLQNTFESLSKAKWPKYDCYLAQLAPLFGPITTLAWAISLSH